MVDKTIPKYQTYTEVVPPAGADILRNGAEQVTEMIAPQPSGLAAWLVRVAANRTQPAPRHAGGAGRFYLVVGGALSIGGRQLGRLGAVWLELAEADTAIAAGSDGVELLVLQFPANAWAYRLASKAAHQERLEA